MKPMIHLQAEAYHLLYTCQILTEARIKQVCAKHISQMHRWRLQVEERKRLNEIQKAVDQSVKRSRYRDEANLSSDLKLLQDLEIPVSKSGAQGKKNRDATFERKRTDAVAKSIKREQARLKNIADE